ncbi:MAG TPA: Uma2 family endonuclease [Verrucomicrobiae bacterium]|jgi:Uma2 family endonuclease|nr:Uma2 family endonuclease [Verrucomicrobiae bacterium]
MASLTIKLPSQRAQTDFNLRRWAELVKDPELAKIEGRVEMDRYGHVIMSPPPAARHGSYQSEIAYLLRSLMQEGRVLTECPISTANGVRAADVAWASPECMKELGNRVCFPRSPEICVEVLSPSNTDPEIQEKMALYFDAGAKEVWLCDTSGAMKFFLSGSSRPSRVSNLCPDFPARVALR